MTSSIVAIQHTIQNQLEDYLNGITVEFETSVAECPPPPYVYISVTSGFISSGEIGQYQMLDDSENPDNCILERSEHAKATFSFTACSVDRESVNGYIFGDEEAQTIAEKMQGYFLHTGYDKLSKCGIAVVDVGSTSNRTAILADTYVRRYGFDITIRYVRSDELTVDKI